MANPEVPPQQTSLEERLDALSRDVRLIADYVREQQRQRAAHTGLMEDLIPVLEQLYEVLQREFQDLENFVQLEDLYHLGHLVLRNVRNFIWLLEQLESLRNLSQDLSRVADEAVPALIDAMDRMEKRGYFAFFREAARVLDTVVTRYSPEELRRLADRVLLLLDTLQDLTQPELLDVLREATGTLQEARNQPQAADGSLKTLLRLLRDPSVRRGLVVSLKILRAFSPKSVENKEVGSWQPG